MHLTLEFMGAKLCLILFDERVHVNLGGRVVISTGQQLVSDGSAFATMAKHMGWNGSARVSILFYKIYSIHFIKKVADPC